MNGCKYKSSHTVLLALDCLAVLLLVCAVSAGTQQAAIDDADHPIKTSQRNPNAVAVVVGISHYHNPDLPQVDFALRDAEAMRQLLTLTLGYPESRVLVRTDASATLAQLKPLIRQELRAKVVPGKSDVFVYYSGHGAPNAETKEGFLIPYDYDPSYRPTSDSAYPLKELYQDLAALKARSVTVVLDACFSGQSDAQQDGKGGMVLKDASPAFIEVKNSIVELPNELVVTASGAQEIATWDRQHQHGLLTYYFLHALHGEAADEQGRVTVERLKEYLQEKVPRAAEELRHRKQMPQVVAVDSNQVLAQLPLSALKTGQATLEQAYGSLQITLLTGGELYIDGVNEGALQAGQVFSGKQIPAGPHQIEVRKEGEQPIQEQVIVMPNQTVERTYNFLPEAPRVEKAYGLIQVSADAGGPLYIDGRRIVDLSPFEKYTTEKIDAGPHQVRVEKQGYDRASQEILVRPNQTVSYEFSLRHPSPAFRPGEARLNPKDGLKYVWIPPGTFMMGCSPGDNECQDNEKPAHQVTITKGFWLGQTEVTVGAYKRFAGATGRQMPDAPGFNSGWANDNMPIVKVSWYDARDYCTWAGGQLPTEAEWEYAARGGSTEARYGPIDEVAWYDKNSGGQTHEVGQKRANGFGLFDTLGNAWEWVNDLGVLRGGSWSPSPVFSFVRVSTHGRGNPHFRLDNTGVRCGGEVFAP
jgi:formylglycine-generating enzyme required for sulfatase activity